MSAKWTNALAVKATVVTSAGKSVSGVITNWTAPGECELDNGARGVLAETWQRRQAVAR